MKRNDTTSDEIELENLSVVTEQSTNSSPSVQPVPRPYITATKSRFVVLALISMVSLGWYRPVSL